jgi:hypothetical protein
MKFKKGDKVKLPFNEVGTVVKVMENQMWGNKYDVKITKATMSTVGEVADFKAEQMKIAKKLTKKQAKEFARIYGGILVYNIFGSEFNDSDLGEDEIDMCYKFMEKQCQKLLKENEHKLSTTQMILDYVHEHF